MIYHNDAENYSVNDYYVLVTAMPRNLMESMLDQIYWKDKDDYDAYFISLYRLEGNNLNQIIFIYKDYNDDGSDLLVNSLVVGQAKGYPDYENIKADSQKGLIPLKEACDAAVLEFYDPETGEFNLNPYVVRLVA